MGKTSYQMIFDQISGLHNILDSLMPEGLAVVTFWSFRLLMRRKVGGGGSRRSDDLHIHTCLLLKLSTIW